MAAAREACEIHGLVVLQDYLAAARAGVAFDSLGPLLALSLVDVAGGMSGPQLFSTIENLAGAMRGCQRDDAASELLRGAARGFANSGDYQSLADTIELANVTRASRSAFSTGVN
ncbi:MAG TPA: hypothetical protein VGR61_07615 [Candidatus Dormibacteraeota bacterium]|nr:hypothetical protein [Candidatus Dormibacteraeota bacterium]